MYDGGTVPYLTVSAGFIHGNDVVEEFLIPDFKSDPNVFIGLTTGRRYTEATLSNVSWRGQNRVDLFRSYKKLRRVSWFGLMGFNWKMYDYVEEALAIPHEFGLVVGLDETGHLKKLRVVEIKLSFPKRSSKLSEAARAGYARLFQLVGGADLEAFSEKVIPTLKNYDESEAYGTTLNYLIEKLEKKKLVLFVSVDWKEDFEWVRALFHRSLSQNFGISLEAANPHQYNSIAEPGSFTALASEVSTSGLELTFVETEGDEYVFIVNKIDDRAAVRNELEAIGYQATSVDEVENKRV